MEIDTVLGSDMLRLSLGHMQRIKNQPAAGAPSEKADVGAIPTSMLKYDGFEEFSTLGKPILTGIDIDIKNRPAEWVPYVEPVKDAEYYEEWYTSRIGSTCHSVERTYCNLDEEDALTTITTLNPEEVRDTFFAWYETYLYELKDGRANGKFDEDEYHDRLQGLNKAYDRLFPEYACVGRAGVEFSGFGFWLNDIRTRFSNGDFGDGDEAYEERLAVWNNAFNSLITGTQGYVVKLMGMLSLASFEEGNGGDRFRMGNSSLVLVDIEKLLNNARDHLLAGGSADSLTDSILNKGCASTSAADWRFLISKECWAMTAEIGKAISRYTEVHTGGEQDKKIIEDACANLIERIKLNAKIGETLKAAFIERLNAAAKNLPKMFKNTFAASDPEKGKG